MKMDKTTQILLSLLRIYIGNEESIAIQKQTQQQWIDVMHLAERQGVSAIAFQSVKMLSEEVKPDIRVMMTWMKDEQEGELFWRRTLALREKLQQMLDETSEDCVLLIMKGTDIAQKYYPSPWLRYSTDVDLVAYLDEVLQNNGFFPDEGGNDKHEVYHIDGITVENHNSLLDECLGETTDEEALLNSILKRKRKIDAEFYYNYLPLHTITHYISKGLSLRHMLDWYLFRKNDGALFSGGYYAMAMDEVCKVVFENEDKKSLSGLAKDLFLFVTFQKRYILRPKGKDVLRHPMKFLQYVNQQIVKYKNVDSRQRTYMWHSLLSKFLKGR